MITFLIASKKSMNLIENIFFLELTAAIRSFFAFISSSVALVEVYFEENKK